MARVLVSCPLPGDALDDLARVHDVEIGTDPRGIGRAGLLARAHAFDALMTLVSDRVDEDVLAAAPRLRVVANVGVGVDNVDLAACARRGVVVTNTPDVLTDATADLTFALLLAACRRVAEGDRLVRSGAWRGFSPTELLGVRVTGATLGVVGLGRIGAAVARRARGFAMRVLYAQPEPAEAAIEAELGARHVALGELFAASDVVVLACPLTPATRGLVSRERLAGMKRGAVLVNAARGPVVDEEALADALDAGHLAAAGLDVYEREPAVSPRLVRSERVVLTPHIGSADAPTRATMTRLSVDAVIAVLAGREPVHRVA
jgi:glyoxylate reductase